MDFGYLAVQTAMVIGLNEALKQTVLKDDFKRFIPIVSIFVGIAVSLLLFPGGETLEGVRDGIISGLMAVGLFSTVQNASTKEVDNT